jgi:aminoglycoside phosphotransferase family enzyme
MTPSPLADPAFGGEAAPDLAAKVAFLSRPATHGVTSVEALETHMSWVFLAGDHAMKLKKPVRFPFLDFSTLAAREHDCREEVRLNARLAPGVYLGLRALQWDGASLALLSPERVSAPDRTVDWLVFMRRLPAEQMLDVRIAAGRVTPQDIDPVVTLLGRFYRDAVTLTVPAEEYVAHFHREQAANREVLLRPQFRLQRATTALDRMDRALVDHAELLYERSRGGRIVDGHGDLRPEHVCLLEPPVIIDCLEFNAALRGVDPFDEAACLGLECDLGGAPWIGPRLVAGLARLLDDRPTPALVQLYTAHRALLRARLAMAHLLDPHPRIPAKWLPLAQRYVQRALAALDGLAGHCPLEDAPLECPSAAAIQPPSPAP